MKRATSRMFPWVVFALSTVAVAAASQSAPTEAAAELERLQGHWEGKGAGGICSITFTGNTIHYRAGTTWYEATFTLPGGTDPRQLRAIIEDSGPEKEVIGETVFVVYKMEGDVLTLATYGPSEEPPDTFDGNNLYIVKKVASGNEVTPSVTDGTETP